VAGGAEPDHRLERAQILNSERMIRSSGKRSKKPFGSEAAKLRSNGSSRLK
jgi:hypothetical protein